MATAELRNAAVALDPTTIADGAEEVVDSVDPGQVRSAKWLITLTDAVNSLYNVAEVLAIQNGSTVTFTVSNKVGDFLAYRTTVVIEGGEFRCKIQNNHTEDLKVDIVRISILI